MSWKNILTTVLVAIGVLTFITVAFASWSTINEGHRGVYICFGERVNNKPVQPGFHWKKPVVCGYKEMSIRVQDVKMSEHVKTSSGLDAKMTATLRFRLNKNKVNWIYDNLGGSNAIKEKIKNSFQGSLKESADDFSDEQLYTTESKQYENKVEQIVKGQLEELGFTIHDVILNNINFNKKLEMEITKKRTMEQKRQRKLKQVQVAKAEAKRKKQEAKGVRDAENIIAQANFSDRYLTYLWITEGLEKGDAMYVPVGNSGMPMFKDVDKHKNNKISKSNKSDTTTKSKEKYNLTKKKSVHNINRKVDCSILKGKLKKKCKNKKK